MISKNRGLGILGNHEVDLNLDLPQLSGPAGRSPMTPLTYSRQQWHLMLGTISNSSTFRRRGGGRIVRRQTTRRLEILRTRNDLNLVVYDTTKILRFQPIFGLYVVAVCFTDVRKLHVYSLFPISLKMYLMDPEVRLQSFVCSTGGKGSQPRL